MNASIENVTEGPAKGLGVAQVFSGVVPVESEEVGAAEVDAVKPEYDIEAGADNVSSHSDPDYPEPTEEERHTLRRVAGSIPAVSYVLCVAELAERASYYGASTVFSNFMEFPLPKGGSGSGAVPKNNPNGHSGALNKGLQFATAFGLLFTFLAYVFPILGAWIADVKLGRFKTIMLGVIIGGVAHVIMIGGAAPSVLRAGNGVAPFVISLFLLAIGAGIFKPNVAPTVIDQYKHQKEYVRTLKSGERQIVDPERTVQRIMLIFYAMINVGAFFAIATTYTEKYVGYWLSFLLPGIVYFVLPLLLLGINKRITKRPPSGSELTNFMKIAWTALRYSKGAFWRRDFWDASSPEVLATKGIYVAWTQRAVDDVRRTFQACIVFLYFPLYNLNDGGIGAVGSNQAAAMTSNGAPNDLLTNMNPVIIIGVTPILTYGLYPLLARYKIHFGPIKRMTFGFLLAAVSGAIGAIVQWRVYKTSPCGYQASTCDGVSPLSIWWQIPNVGLGAISELFCNVTAYELAYVRAPPHLKSVVMAMFLFTNALSSALGEITVPAVKDPYLVWVWAGPAIALFAQTAVFYLRHHGIDNEVYILDQENVSQAPLTVPEKEQNDIRKD
ncbi:Oligopeptide transporter [Niveomyces insectorum RCEF 264]|uniref:Oligopeptide transporter n=1 Tax=Niveomyces insectorum RCEF 264 TaxID=1081102 RepID=A0A167N8A3_9HYPO|nr:Oligopeptide transporter [Niveomyces insectorum RCEF 264]